MARSARTELDERGRKFCVEIAKGIAPHQAALNAGYTDSTAKYKPCGWLKQPLYIAEINRLRGIVGQIVDVRLKEAAAKKPRVKREPKPEPPPKDIKPETPDTDAEMRAHAERVAAAAAAVDINKEWVLRELVANHYRAIMGDRPNLAASNTAVTQIGVELGMFVRKTAVEWRDVTALTPEEVSAATSKALEELGNNLPPELLKLMSAHMGTVQ